MMLQLFMMSTTLWLELATIVQFWQWKKIEEIATVRASLNFVNSKKTLINLFLTTNFKIF